jgi:hypothetical protein
VVNPNTLHALIEGGIGFALTNTVKSRITFSNGGADQSNFFYTILIVEYQPLRKFHPSRIRQHGGRASVASMTSGASLCAAAPAGLRRDHVPDFATALHNVFDVALFDEMTSLARLSI